jgi:hypothetical protein
MNWKSLELAITMDARELKTTMEQANCLEKENGDLDTKLRSQASDLWKSIRTNEHLQLNI